MKKVLSILIAATMLLSACSSNETTSKKKKKSNKGETTVEEKVKDKEDDDEDDDEDLGDLDFDDSDETVIEVEIGDTITYGSYPQGADGTVGPIEWRVLDVQDGMALLISEMGLDAKPYNEMRGDVSWETCTLRAWLNNDFMNTAFTEEEQEQIANATVINDCNPNFGTDGGNDTVDKIFLLSLEEVQVYFNLEKYIDNDEDYCSGDECCCRPTDYAVAQGVYVYSATKSTNKKYNGLTGWWLRSPGFHNTVAAHVTAVGVCTGSGSVDADSVDGAVRPSMWIDLTGKGRDRILEQDLSKVEVGDYITFGTYPQNSDGAVRPIKWQVLEIKDGKALIISKYGLDCKPYNQDCVAVTWENCTLRAWLNQDFMNIAFTQEEQQRIVETTLKNEDNPKYGTAGGNDTTDKVFLLSINEVMDYYHCSINEKEDEPNVYGIGDRNCWCFPTEYAINNGVTQIYPCCWWWLRSSGDVQEAAAGAMGKRIGLSYYVDDDGRDGKYGAAVRPVMWIELD